MAMRLLPRSGYDAAQPEVLCTRCKQVTDSFRCPKCDAKPDNCRKCGKPLNQSPNEDYHPIHVTCATKSMSTPKQDIIIQRPEEEPGYGFGI